VFNLIFSALFLGILIIIQIHAALSLYHKKPFERAPENNKLNYSCCGVEATREGNLCLEQHYFHFYSKSFQEAIIVLSWWLLTMTCKV